jgi:hypothetical protein
VVCCCHCTSNLSSCSAAAKRTRQAHVAKPAATHPRPANRHATACWSKHMTMPSLCSDRHCHRCTSRSRLHVSGGACARPPRPRRIELMGSGNARGTPCSCTASCSCTAASSGRSRPRSPARGHGSARHEAANEQSHGGGCNSREGHSGASQMSAPPSPPFLHSLSISRTILAETPAQGSSTRVRACRNLTMRR